MTESTVSEVAERLEAALAEIPSGRDSNLIKFEGAYKAAVNPDALDDLHEAVATLLSTIKATDGGPSREEVLAILREPQPSVYQTAERILSLFSSEGKEDHGLSRDHDPTTGVWLEIESAPKDGTPILVWRVHPHARHATDDKEWCGPVVTQWTTHNGGGWTWYGMVGRFTHWMPLPEAPSSMAARDMGLSRAPQGADDASGNTPKPVSQPDHAPGEGGAV